MKRTQMPPRAVPMRLCGKQYGSVAEAEESAAGQKPGAVIETWCPCRAVHVRQPAVLSQVLPARPSVTGFPLRVKLLVRARAGFGDIDDACCEACALPLRRYGGQVQHIVARGMGGTSRLVLATVVNGCLLCGTSSSGCHGLAESRDPGMRDRGFWLPRGSDPRLEPMTLHSGVKAWRGTDGRYLYTDPRREAA